MAGTGGTFDHGQLLTCHRGDAETGLGHVREGNCRHTVTVTLDGHRHARRVGRAVGIGDGVAETFGQRRTGLQLVDVRIAVVQEIGQLAALGVQMEVAILAFTIYLLTNSKNASLPSLTGVIVCQQGDQQGDHRLVLAVLGHL